MIVVFQENKIIAIDKNLLNMFDSDLMHLSEIISPIELNISSLKNETINILSKNFKISEIPLLSINNIKAFDLSLEDLTQTNLFEENSINKPVKESFSLEEELQQNLTNFPDNLIDKSQNENIEIPVQLENKKETENETFTPREENKEIVISFEDEFDEISKILSLSNNEAKELIKKDLQQASKDLGIDIDTLEDLFKTLLVQINENKEEFKKAINEKNYESLHRIAHSLKGAALNLRLSNIAIILKTIDEQSKQQVPIENIEHLVEQFYHFIDKLTLDNTNNEKNNETFNNSQNIQISEPIKNLIIQTIKNYLSTQNEKKLKKDLKYIEKILHTKINSFDDLQKLVKVNK